MSDLHEALLDLQKNLPHVGKTETVDTGKRGRFENDQAIALLRSVADGTAAAEPNGCVLWPGYVYPNGYPYCTFDGHSQPAGRVALLVAGIEPPTPDHEAGHAPAEVCGNRHCVSVEHLSWQTREDQLRNQRIDGTDLTGEGNPMAKLTAVRVRQMRELYAAGQANQYELADRYRVSVMTVNRAVRGKTWQDAGGTLTPRSPYMTDRASV